MVAGSAVLLSGCHIYKKYETPQTSALTRAYAEARKAPADSAAFGNLLWEDVFTDPVLADLISQALSNNNDLKNAQLNVTMAHAQLKGEHHYKNLFHFYCGFSGGVKNPDLILGYLLIILSL